MKRVLLSMLVQSSSQTPLCPNFTKSQTGTKKKKRIELKRLELSHKNITGSRQSVPDEALMQIVFILS